MAARRLAAVARGELTAEPEHVDQAADSVMQLLYWPAGAHAFAVPDGFPRTALGGMLAQARARSRQVAGRPLESTRGIDADAPSSPESTRPFRIAPESPEAETS